MHPQCGISDCCEQRKWLYASRIVSSSTCRVPLANALSGNKRENAVPVSVGLNHFLQKHSEHEGLRLAQSLHGRLRDLFCLWNHLPDDLFAGLGDRDLGFALIAGIAGDVQQSPVAQAVEHAPGCGRVNRGRADDVDDGAGAVIHHRAQHDELNGREFFSVTQLLEDGRVVLIGAAQQVPDLLGKIIALFGRRVALLYLIIKDRAIGHVNSRGVPGSAKWTRHRSITFADEDYIARDKHSTGAIIRTGMMES